MPNCSDGYATVDVTSAALFCGSNGFLVSDTTPFYPVGKALSCPSRALLDDDTVESLDCSSLTVGEACVVTCADGYTAAGDTETTLTCFFDPELQSMLLKCSAQTCKLVPRDVSPFMPSTVSHDCPDTVFEKSTSVHSCLFRQCSDLRDGGFHCFDLRFRRSLGERPNASASHLSTDVLHWRPLAQRLFIWT